MIMMPSVLITGKNDDDNHAMLAAAAAMASIADDEETTGKLDKRSRCGFVSRKDG